MATKQKMEAVRDAALEMAKSLIDFLLLCVNDMGSEWSSGAAPKKGSWRSRAMKVFTPFWRSALGALPRAPGPSETTL
eukprot:879997-Pyramimonas_sp.AAC.1